MPVVMICSPADLDGELSSTMLWRSGIERLAASAPDQAMALALNSRPQMVAIDRRLPDVRELVASLRQEPKTRSCSVVILARGDFDTSEIEILEAGANAILRFPAGATWDSRLDQLLSVPTRCEARFSVEFGVEASYSGRAFSGQALNLSTRGMLLSSTAPLSVGEDIRFTFRLPGAFVDGEAQVVRQAAANQYGLCFRALERDGPEVIEQYVARAV